MSKYTDRYIKIPLKLLDTRHELMGKEMDASEMIDIFARINPFDIESYRVGIPAELDFESGNLVATAIQMKSGDCHLAYMHIDEFEILLNKHNDR